MPTVNTSCIQARFDEQLARLYYLVNYDPDSVLSYALSGVDLNDVGIIVAADVNSLPNLQYGNPNLPDGMVYFVQSLGIIVISSNNTWLTLDGVLVRTDSIFSQSWSWGRNTSGQLGDNTTVSKSSPVSVVGGFIDWLQVSAGGAASISVGFSAGVRTNGTAWTWGENSGGELGDGTAVDKSSPVSVVGGFTNWCQISTGKRQTTLAVRTNGSAWGWGAGACGILGNNCTSNRSSPVSVIGGFTDWCQVSAGYQSSLAVRQNGTAWAWGEGLCGILGNNCTSDSSSPVSVVGGFTDWCQVSGAKGHSLGVRQNGAAWGWGEGTFGRLGDNTTTNRSSPVSVIGGFTDWCQVSAGYRLSLAVRQNGTAWAWGSGICGQLGDNTTVSKSSPVSVVGGFSDWCQVSAGSSFSLGLRTNGSAWAWGLATCGILGDNTTVNKSSPVSVVGGYTDWYQVSAGPDHSLAIRNLG
jgi:alpha-tubulin suppressor-like RCC1 family protein